MSLSSTKNNKDWKKDFSKLTDGKKIYIYCQSGNRSEQMIELLKAENISSENLGGFDSLKKDLPFTSAEKK